MLSLRHRRPSSTCRDPQLCNAALSACPRGRLFRCPLGDLIPTHDFVSPPICDRLMAGEHHAGRPTRSNTEQRLDALAERTGSTKTSYALAAIEAHLDDLEDFYLAEERMRDFRSGDAILFADLKAELGLDA